MKTVNGLLETVIQQMNELNSIYRAAINRSGISENEFFIWYILILADGEHSQHDICNTWFFSKQTVNTIVSRMVKRGYAILEVVPGTRNRKNIRLTEEGRRYGEQLILPISHVEQRTLDRISPSEFAASMAALGKYIAILKEEMHNAKAELSE